MKLVTRSLLVCAAIAFFAAVGSAATFTVNVIAESNDSSPGNGICADSAGKCSVWAALQETNALPGADTINVPAGVYSSEVLTAGVTWDRFIIKDSVTINGAGSGSTFFQIGSSFPSLSFLLDIKAGATVTVNGVTFRNCAISGSGGTSPILVDQASLTLNNCVVRDNVLNANAFGVKGAGIAVYGGTLVLYNTSVINNILKVTGLPTDHVDSRGGAIYGHNSTVTLNSTFVSGNQLNDAYPTSLPSFGAGIALDGYFNFTATNSLVNGNTANFAGSSSAIRGVGIAAQSTGTSTFNLTNTQVSSNTVTGSVGSFGGGIYLETTGTGTLSSTIDKSTIAYDQINDGFGWGGGMMIYSNGRAINQSITNSTIAGNVSGGYGGGIFMVNGGSVSTTGSATLNLTNDTISGNHAYQEGGGVYFYKYNSLASTFLMNLNFVTVANNVANWGTAGATSGGGGIADFGNTVNLKNSVIANNSVGTGGFSFDLQGTFYSQGYNHIGALATGILNNTNATDGFGTVSLGPLQNNSGPTYTQLPTFGPLVDQIPNGVNGCGTTITKDQRGLGRPAYTKCDKGAVEWWYLN
jgi:hypothetical protein